MLASCIQKPSDQATKRPGQDQHQGPISSQPLNLFSGCALKYWDTLAAEATKGALFV